MIAAEQFAELRVVFKFDIDIIVDKYPTQYIPDHECRSLENCEIRGAIVPSTQDRFSLAPFRLHVIGKACLRRRGESGSNVTGMFFESAFIVH